VAFVDEIPHTATGKIQKISLRERFKGYVLPTATRRRMTLPGLPLPIIR
jgi:acyl-coenzyme A synthetase/AMP-(fatty) acid ligase